MTSTYLTLQLFCKSHVSFETYGEGGTYCTVVYIVSAVVGTSTSVQPHNQESRVRSSVEGRVSGRSDLLSVVGYSTESSHIASIEFCCGVAVPVKVTPFVSFHIRKKFG